MLNLTIREAVPEDAEALIDLVRRVAAEPGGNLLLSPGEFRLTAEEERQVLARFAASGNSVYLVAVDGERIVGLLSLNGGTRLANRHVVDVSMSVDRDWRGQGVGTRLMERALAWVRDHPQIKRVELLVFARNAPAIHLYEKFGFQVEGRRRKAAFRDGEYLDDLEMALLPE